MTSPLDRQPPAVLVVVGTDIHPFDRLLTWLARWHAQRPNQPSLLVQHGHSRRPPLPGAVPFLGHDELALAMTEATLVVSHGGPATITEARRCGRLPIVVARDPRHGEHVDDHQQLFTRRLARAGMIKAVDTEPDLVTALESGLADPASFQLAADPVGQADRAAAVARVGRIVEDLMLARPRRPRGSNRSRD